VFDTIQTYFLKKRLNSTKDFKVAVKNSKTIGVLFNEDEADKEKLEKLVLANFEVELSEIQFLGFSHKKNEIADRADVVVNKKDFSIFGQPKSELVSEFINYDYKLLFNFFGKGDLFLEHIAQHTTAKLKVGLVESNERINDFSIALESNNLDFFKESSKYIKRII
jgi:hypothetical protein